MFFQDFHIFHATLRENVGFGDLKKLSNTERILLAMQKGGADKLPSRFPKGLDQWLLRKVIKEGAMLSGGEKQRVAVSRAHMSDKEILIFDEPAAALDPIAEMKQFHAIREKIEGRTAILISHRVGFARLADRIIVLNHGRLAESGTHEELMSSNGIYAGFFREQARWYEQVGGEADEQIADFA
jgi:ATP-binding cassette subfamily B protein